MAERGTDEEILEAWINYCIARMMYNLAAPEREATHAIGVVIYPRTS